MTKTSTPAPPNHQFDPNYVATAVRAYFDSTRQAAQRRKIEAELSGQKWLEDAMNLTILAIPTMQPLFIAALERAVYGPKSSTDVNFPKTLNALACRIKIEEEPLKRQLSDITVMGKRLGDELPTTIEAAYNEIRNRTLYWAQQTLKLPNGGFRGRI